MPPSKSKKTKDNNGRASNQPSLFSFWGKPTKKKIGGSKTTTLDTSDWQHNAGGEAAVATSTGNKRRRVDEVSSSSPTTTTAAVSSSEIHHQQNTNNNKKTAVTPEEELNPTINVPAVASKSTSLHRFAYRVAEASAGKKNKTSELCTNDKIQSPATKKYEITNKDNDDNAIEVIDTAEPEPKEASKSDSEQDEEDQDGNNSENDDDAQSSPSLPPTNAHHNQQNPEGLSDYELLRLRNIARNNARLEALGLLPNQDNIQAKPKTKKRTSKRPAKIKKSNDQPVTRRSTRQSTRLSQPPSDGEGAKNAGTTTVTTLDAKAKSGTIATEEEQSVEYEVSPMVHYEMEQQQKHQKPSLLSNENRGNNGSAAPTLIPLEYRLAPPQGLSAIYSLNFYDTTGWLVGAGKAGIIALWNCGPPSPSRNDESGGNEKDDFSNYVDPVVTWKAHSGRWISEAQFLTGHNNGAITTSPSCLVTAGNDGSVCLWDLRQVSTGTGIPKLVQQSNKSWHASGIFAMDVAQTTIVSTAKIATGSKDKTVAIANLTYTDNSGPSSTPCWRSYIHSAKVGAVKFRDEHVLATASDDGCVAILDDRMRDGKGPPVALLEDLHQGRPHSVVWQDNASHVLLTAGLDSVIQAWDIRYLNQESPSPVLEFYGHVPTTARRCKRIHHPALYQHNAAGGQFVLTGGEGSHALSMFEMQQPLTTPVTNPDHAERRNLIRSTVYSRGSLPDDCCHTDIGSIAVQQDLVAATVDGEVLLLRPSI